MIRSLTLNVERASLYFSEGAIAGANEKFPVAVPRDVHVHMPVTVRVIDRSVTCCTVGNGINKTG